MERIDAKDRRRHQGLWKSLRRLREKGPSWYVCTWIGPSMYANIFFLIVKVLKGPVWEGRLANFVNLFDDRKKEIQYELSIQTTLGVNSANDSLANVQKNILSMNPTLNALLFAP